MEDDKVEMVHGKLSLQGALSGTAEIQALSEMTKARNPERLWENFLRSTVCVPVEGMNWGLRKDSEAC